MDREFSLLLPKSDGGNEDLKTNTSFLLIGANGAGKTRLGTWIEMTSPQKEKCTEFQHKSPFQCLIRLHLRL